MFQTVSTTVRGVKRCSSHPIDQQQWPPFANPYSSFATKHAQIYRSLCRHIAANEHPIYTDTQTHRHTKPERERHKHKYPHTQHYEKSIHTYRHTFTDIHIHRRAHSLKKLLPFSEVSYTFFYKKLRIGVSPPVS